MFSFIFSTIGSIIAGIFSLVLYVMTALGLYTLSKRDGLGYAWIAWIPICQFFLVGKLIGDKLFNIPYAQWWLLFYPAIVSLLSAVIPVELIDDILYLSIYVVYAAAYYKLFSIYAPERAVLYTITGFIIAPLMGIYTFLIRNNPKRALPQ